MASRPIELPGASGGGWQRTLTGPVKGESVKRGRKKVHEPKDTEEESMTAVCIK